MNRQWPRKKTLIEKKQSYPLLNEKHQVRFELNSMNRFCEKVKHNGIFGHNMSFPKNKNRYCQTFIFMCSKIPVLPNFEQNMSFILYPIFNTRHQEVKFQKNLKSFTESFKLAHFANSPAIYTPQMPHFGQRFFSKLQISHFNDNLMSVIGHDTRKNWCRKIFFEKWKFGRQKWPISSLKSLFGMGVLL